MNIKLFLLCVACKGLPNDIIGHIWSFVKTDAKKTIQEFLQKMYYRKIERTRLMFLKLDSFSNTNTHTRLNNVYNCIVNHAKVANYMYIQDTERFIRRLIIIKWRYYDWNLTCLVDKIVENVTREHLIGKARMARILALRTNDYKLSTQSYIDFTFSPIVQRMLVIMHNSLSDVKIEVLDGTLKYYYDNVNKDIFNNYNNPLSSYLIANLPINNYNIEIE